MINHLLSEEELGEEQDSRQDSTGGIRDSLLTSSSGVSRLTSVSRPSWSTPLGESIIFQSIFSSIYISLGSIVYYLIDKCKLTCFIFFTSTP